MNDNNSFDVIISGGGFVGLLFALRLAMATRWRILVLEQGAGAPPIVPRLDVPSLALTSSTLASLNRLGLSVQSVPIRSIHVSEQGAFGSAVLRASSIRRDAFGGVVEVDNLYHQLREQLSTHPQVSIWEHAHITTYNWVHHQRLHISCNGEERLIQGKLLVVAEGASSPTRSHLGMDARVSNYGHVAILANIQLRSAPEYDAYERFSTQGPRALLPLADHHMALVWVVDQSDVPTLMAQTEQAWVSAITQQFGALLCADVQRVGSRRVKPLTSVISAEQVGHCAVLVGNAAHTLHPIAGQGFNLTVRDLDVLADLLIDADLSNPAALNRVLQRYVYLRRDDQRIVDQACHGLVKLFGIDNPLCKVARGLGLAWFDHAKPLKDRLTLRAMGE